jgi:hypothetical protein
MLQRGFDSRWQTSGALLSGTLGRAEPTTEVNGR